MPLNENIHIALTDHLAFAINRMKQGLMIRNPFLLKRKRFIRMNIKLRKK